MRRNYLVLLKMIRRGSGLGRRLPTHGMYTLAQILRSRELCPTPS
ncbi:hypothetical protein HNQ62_002696 [Sulfurisphaera ohwakuensis]|uniref:Uncharacterized protein n=1 Tax=Sulfurisphaera ohwakuensis TaxID=69656 RepID=A0A7J9RXE1_SULOH|nr:hypothetical protein [Sulfurisphaera ohwakuensis]